MVPANVKYRVFFHPTRLMHLKIKTDARHLRFDLRPLTLNSYKSYLSLRRRLELILIIVVGGRTSPH